MAALRQPGAIHRDRNCSVLASSICLKMRELSFRWTRLKPLEGTVTFRLLFRMSLPTFNQKPAPGHPGAKALSHRFRCQGFREALRCFPRFC